MVLDYTDWTSSARIRVVNHEKIKGGSPHMQFALLRTLYDAYTWYDEDGVTAHYPTFLMDANALGGVTIKKLLLSLKPKGFDIDKDEALMMTKKELSSGRQYKESEVDGSIIELNPNFGTVESYYIDELSTQLGNYHLDDTKLQQDFVMCLMMGVAYIVKKIPKAMKAASLNPLAGYEATIQRTRPIRGQSPRTIQTAT